MFMSMSIKAPISDVEELDRLSKLKKLSRSQYIRQALEHYDINPTPLLITKVNDLSKGEPTRPIALMLNQEHIDIIDKYQANGNATKVQIIRQALIQEAALDGQTYKIVIPPPIDPKWEGIWVKATDIYSQLGMHRNNLYRAMKSAKLEAYQGEKTTHHPERWYRLTDIMRYYRLDEIQAKRLSLAASGFNPEPVYKSSKFKRRDWKELARYWNIDTNNYSNQDLPEQIIRYAESHDDIETTKDIKDFVTFMSHRPKTIHSFDTEEEKLLTRLADLSLWKLINIKGSQEVRRQFKELFPYLMTFSDNTD